MGYYSTFDYYIKKEVKLDPELKNKLEELYSDENNANIFGFYGVKLETYDDGMLENIKLHGDEEMSKFYDADLFAIDLSKVMVEGMIYLNFIGEEGQYYGYMVTKGYVVPLAAVPLPVYVLQSQLDGLIDANEEVIKEHRIQLGDNAEWAISIDDPHGMERAIRHSHEENALGEGLSILPPGEEE